MALWRSRLIAALASAAFLLPASHARRRRRAPKGGRRRLRPSMQPRPAPGTRRSSKAASKTNPAKRTRAPRL